MTVHASRLALGGKLGSAVPLVYRTHSGPIGCPRMSIACLVLERAFASVIAIARREGQTGFVFLFIKMIASNRTSLSPKDLLLRAHRFNALSRRLAETAVPRKPAHQCHHFPEWQCSFQTCASICLFHYQVGSRTLDGEHFHQGQFHFSCNHLNG